MAASGIVLVAATLLFGTVATAAPPPTHAGAQQNYVLNCMGCHGADGAGVPGRIPGFPESICRFVRSTAGRHCLAHVPGASNAVLTDAELADVLNWLLWQYGR